MTRPSASIGDTEVTYRSLSRAEALHLQSFQGRPDEAEVYILAKGTGCTDDEAQAFREGVDLETAGLLIDGILELSGLTNGPKA